MTSLTSTNDVPWRVTVNLTRNSLTVPFGASSIIVLSDQIPNGDFGVNPDGLIAYVVLAVFKFY
jgi:hypothetical protein